jgi:hypothetical protein
MHVTQVKQKPPSGKRGASLLRLIDGFSDYSGPFAVRTCSIAATDGVQEWGEAWVTA